MRSHTLLQPDRPGAVRPLFPCRRLACLTSCEQRFPAWAESSSWRSFLRGCFPGVGADLRDPTHRGRQNQIDRSMLCRRSIVNLLSQEHSWLLLRHLCVCSYTPNVGAKGARFFPWGADALWQSTCLRIHQLTLPSP